MKTSPDRRKSIATPSAQGAHTAGVVALLLVLVTGIGVLS